MVYAVIAAEGIYQGYHGIKQKAIIEVSSLEEAHEIAAEMSIEIMDSYPDVYDELEEAIQNEIDDNDAIEWTDEEINDFRSEIYNDNIYYDLYELDEEKIKNKSYEELKKELHSNFEEFLIKYQKIDD